MAEAAGLAIGLVGLAGLFNNAVDAFDYIRIAQNFQRDFQTGQLKLDVARLRLSRWGESVGLSSAFDEAQLRASSVLSETDVALAANILQQLLDLFNDAQSVSKRFNSATVSSELPLDATSATVHQWIRNVSISRVGKIGLVKKVRWSLHQEKHLSRLIDDIRELVDDLMSAAPGGSAGIHRQLCERELAELNGDSNLALVQEAARDQDPVLAEAVAKLTDQSQTVHNNISVSGNNNNSGMVIGMSTGAINGWR